MTWAQNVVEDNAKQAYFVRATARLKVNTWTLHSGNIYVASFPYGPVTSLSRNSTALTERASISAIVGGDEFYYDRDTQLLYARVISGGDPDDTSTYMVAEFYLFFSSQDCIWHETPDDESTPLVEWKGVLNSPPEFRVTVPALAMGYYPIEPTSLILRNDQSLNYVLYHGSFRRTLCECWQQVGELEEDNVELMVTGLFGLTIQVDDQTISFQVLDRSITFDGVVPVQYYPAGSTVDPKFVGTPLMKFWGLPAAGYNNSDYYKPVFELANIDYNADAPTTSNNRKFALVHDPDARYGVSQSPGQIKPGAQDRFDLTNAADINKFKPGDTVWFQGPNDRYGLVVDSLGSVEVYFNAAVPGATQNGNLITSFIKDVYMIKDNGQGVHKLLAGRDWLETLHANDYRGLTLQAACEANNGASTFDPSVDSLWCHVVGITPLPTVGGVEVTDNGYLCCFSQGVNVLYDFLKRECGLTEDEIDLPAFDAARAVIDWNVFLPVPFSQLTETPQKRDVLDVILRSLLVRAYFNREGKFTLIPYGPADTPAATVEKEDIISSSYQIDYSTMSKLQLVFLWDAQSINRIQLSGSKDDFNNGTAQLRFLTDLQVNQIYSALTSGLGTHLHQVENVMAFEHIVTDDLSVKFGPRVLDLYGDRHGMMKVVTRRQFTQRNPGEDLTVERQQLLGQTYTGLPQTDIFEVLEISKSQDGVEFQLDDTKAAREKQDESYW